MSKSKNGAGYLCGRCRSQMCPDCQSISDEYQQLLDNWRLKAAGLEFEIKRLQEENARLGREVEMWKGFVRARVELATEDALERIERGRELLEGIGAG